MDQTDISGNCVEHVRVWVGALGRERAALTAFHCVDIGSARLFEGRKTRDVARRERCIPILAGEIHAFRRHRLIRRRAETLTFQAFDTRFVMFLDLGEALLDGFVGHMVEADTCTWQIVEKRFKRRMEQRQPVLLALIAPPAAHRLVKRIFARCAAKKFDVTRAEQRGWGLAKGDFAHRHKRKFLHRLGAALRLRVEGLDAFEIVAKEIQPDGIDAAWWKKIEDTAAHREFAGLHDRARALEAIETQAAHKFSHIDALARSDRLECSTDKRARRQALQHGIDGREHNRCLFEGTNDKFAERRDTL